MILRGIVRDAELVENPPGSDTIEMIVRAQGVGPSQPRKFILPFSLLLEDPTLEPESIRGRAFQAELEPGEGDDAPRAASFSIAEQRILRPESPTND
jgi:hypothetical protein